MSRFTLYTYQDIQEFNRIYKRLEAEGKQVHNFLFQGTWNLLQESDIVTIDISALVENIKYNPGNLHFAIQNFSNLNDSSKVIIKVDLAQQALEYFYAIFDQIKPLETNPKKKTIKAKVVPFKRKDLFTYKNGVEQENIIEFADLNGIPFTNFSRLNGTENKQLRLVCDEKNKALVDITSVVQSISRNPQVIFLVEQILDSFPYYEAIVREDMVKEALDSFRLLFHSHKPVQELYQGLVMAIGEQEAQPTAEKVNRVVDLEGKELSAFFNTLSLNLIGHGEFKRRFMVTVQNFIILNQIKEKKVFSIFLLGNSGLGKTEVARVIKSALNTSSTLININFGNYSSQDALNSLIGSPRGYIGSEDGELGVKIRKSKAGVVLCDEFEKTTHPVFNFFLELLEDGQFTDSQSREYNLDGYIIIFTSNMNEAQFLKQIPPELQSRLDLVCEFKPLTRQEKIEYVDYRIQTFIGKLRANKPLLVFSPEDECYFREINFDSTDNLRDIERMIEERILNHLTANGDSLVSQQNESQ